MVTDDFGTCAQCGRKTPTKWLKADKCDICREKATPNGRLVFYVAIERAVFGILEMVYGPGWQADPHLKDTPHRVAGMYEEMLGGHEFNFTTMPNEDPKYDQIVLVDRISFTSMCAHHLLPFTGQAAIAYIPQGQIAGLSKLARAVEHFARRLQLQERLTQQVADFLQEKLDPLGVAVVIEAQHMCMHGRGVRKPGTVTRTSVMQGVFRTQQASREELMFLLRGGNGNVST